MAFHIDQLTHEVVDWERNQTDIYHHFVLYEDRLCLHYLLARLENVKGEGWRDKKGKYRVVTKG